MEDNSQKKQSNSSRNSFKVYETQKKLVQQNNQPLHSHRTYMTTVRSKNSKNSMNEIQKYQSQNHDHGKIKNSDNQRLDKQPEMKNTNSTTKLWRIKKEKIKQSWMFKNKENNNKKEENKVNFDKFQEKIIALQSNSCMKKSVRFSVDKQDTVIITKGKQAHENSFLSTNLQGNTTFLSNISHNASYNNEKPMVCKKNRKLLAFGVLTNLQNRLDYVAPKHNSPAPGSYNNDKNLSIEHQNSPIRKIIKNKIKQKHIATIPNEGQKQLLANLDHRFYTGTKFKDYEQNTKDKRERYRESWRINKLKHQRLRQLVADNREIEKTNFIERPVAPLDQRKMPVNKNHQESSFKKPVKKNLLRIQLSKKIENLLSDGPAPFYPSITNNLQQNKFSNSFIMKNDHAFCGYLDQNLLRKTDQSDYIFIPGKAQKKTYRNSPQFISKSLRKAF